MTHLVEHILRTLKAVEQITRPPRMGHDLDLPHDGTEPQLSDDELVGVRGLLQERYEDAPASLPIHLGRQWRDQFMSNLLAQFQTKTSAPVNHTGAGAEPASAVVSRNWVGWAVPAICTVLAEHFPYYDDGAAMYECVDDMGCVHASFGDTHAWREHLAPLIAVHLESALAHEFPASK